MYRSAEEGTHKSLQYHTDDESSNNAHGRAVEDDVPAIRYANNSGASTSRGNYAGRAPRQNGSHKTTPSAADPHPSEESSADSYDNVPLILGNSQQADGIFPRARHILGFMGFLGFANVYAMRVNLSVAVVAMINHTAIPDVNGTVLDVCPMGPETNSTVPVREGDFDWDEATQGIVLGAFFYGYVLTQIPGGRMAEMLGGKYIYGFGVLITAIFTLLTPIAAYNSFPALVVVRILEGMGEGVTFPAMHAMLARWVPPLERSKFAACVYAGANFGTVVSLPLSGWLCSLDFMGGWPLAFYIFGVLGLVWFAFWMWLVYDTPHSHPRISRDERNYIERAVQRVDDELADPEDDVIPWRSIFTCVPLWAILITQCGQSWAFYTQLTELPTYMKNIMHMNIEQNAVLSALPYLTSWIFAVGCSIVADWLLARGYLTQKNSYKMWNTIASTIPSLGLIGVGWAGCDWRWVMVMLAGAGAFQGAVYPGNQMNHIALSPKYAGTMYGITNAAANTCGFMAPYIIGLIINGNETLTQWRLVFMIAAAANTFGNLFYVLFASAEEQPWSKSRRGRH